MSAEIDTLNLETVLEYLKFTRGFDFGAYKPSSLERRIKRRMQQVRSNTYEEYLDYLQVHQDEFQSLFDTILINVTSFFRDPEAWAFIAERIVPNILGQKDDKEPIRIWVAGCASGEEACSISIVLAEAIGMQAFKERVKIYATDLDEDALNLSRTAAYGERQVASLPSGYLEKYFDRQGDRFIFDRDLRRSIIFGRHDLLQDAPISKIDLLLCRNTLMYFNAEAQARILSRFHFAISEGGFLFLGKAETLITHSQLFAPIDLKNRVFTKVFQGKSRDRNFLYSSGIGEMVGGNSVNGLIQDAAFESSGDGQVLIDAGGKLTAVNSKAREMFTLRQIDVGELFKDLELSYRPVELRSGIEQATLQLRDVIHKDVTWALPSGEMVILEIRISPLASRGNEPVGTRIVFQNVTELKRLQLELLNFNQELENAYEEVQSTNEELQTTNEELQSTVEELETTNEEMQSTNEELEAMNEELQSTNEELETINGELRIRSVALNSANTFLETILAGIEDGIIVLNADLQVVAWNPCSEDLWGIRGEEAMGKHLLNLDIGLPVEQLRIPIRNCLSDKVKHQLKLEAINRRGRRFECANTISPLKELPDGRSGVIIVSQCQQKEDLEA